MKVYKIIALSLSLSVIVICAYTVVSFLTYGSDTAPEKVDAAIVLGAASYGDKPSPVFRERINHAIWLYRNRFVKKIIFTGARDSDNEPAASAVATQYAAGRGVLLQDILGEDKSTTTEENLFFARELAGKCGLKTFLIVSDPLHMKRAMMLAENLGMEARQSPTPTTRYRSLGSRVQFLAREIYFYENYTIRKFPGRLARMFFNE